MLVLTRKENQPIMIGSDVCVVVTRIRRGRVSIAIQAPPDMPIQREEIRLQIHDSDSRWQVVTS